MKVSPLNAEIPILGENQTAESCGYKNSDWIGEICAPTGVGPGVRSPSWIPSSLGGLKSPKKMPRSQL